MRSFMLFAFLLGLGMMDHNNLLAFFLDPISFDSPVSLSADPVLISALDSSTSCLP